MHANRWVEVEVALVSLSLALAFSFSLCLLLPGTRLSASHHRSRRSLRRHGLLLRAVPAAALAAALTAALVAHTAAAAAAAAGRTPPRSSEPAAAAVGFPGTAGCSMRRCEAGRLCGLRLCLCKASAHMHVEPEEGLGVEGIDVDLRLATVGDGLDCGWAELLRHAHEVDPLRVLELDRVLKQLQAHLRRDTVGAARHCRHVADAAMRPRWQLGRATLGLRTGEARRDIPNLRERPRIVSTC